jgi:UDP-N-acetylmuramoyl-tripeptide--D-alanyl-D-alanine ligase
MFFLKKIIKRIFQYEARLVLYKYKPKLILVVGSVGKTSARDALYLIFSKRYFVRKTEKSFTAELGVPLTIIGCAYGTGTMWQWVKNIFVGLRLLIRTEQYPSWLILEIDCDKPGDATGLASWLVPDMVIVNAMGAIPSHLEPFQTIDALLAEQKALLYALPRTGCIVYNSDDEYVSRFVGEAVRELGVSVISVSLSGTYTILYGKAYGREIPVGMTFEASHADKVTIFGSIGLPNEYACRLAVCAAEHFGISRAESSTALNQFQALPGRMNIIAGIKETTIIDDSYNASPIAFEQSLRTLEEVVCTGRKIAVVGDMLELGKYSTEEHRKLAHRVASAAQICITVGVRSRTVADELLLLSFGEENIFQTDDAHEAGQKLQEMLAPGDVVLIKGSQAMRLERVVEEVMRHPQDKATLLVRQEPEWLKRG